MEMTILSSFCWIYIEEHELRKLLEVHDIEIRVSFEITLPLKVKEN